MAFCSNLRDLDVFMYVSNRVDFGHLVNPETYDITRTEPEMYQIFDNEQDWEARFIHAEYPENFNPDKKNLQVSRSRKPAVLRFGTKDNECPKVHNPLKVKTFFI